MSWGSDRERDLMAHGAEMSGLMDKIKTDPSVKNTGAVLDSSKGYRGSLSHHSSKSFTVTSNIPKSTGSLVLPVLAVVDSADTRLASLSLSHKAVGRHS